MSRLSNQPRYDRLLEFLTVLERPVAYDSDRLSSSRQGMWSKDCATIDRFIQVLYEDGWVLTFNWMAWQVRAERLYSNPHLLTRARVSTLQRLLTFHLRKDHFNDGHIFLMIREGHIGAILRRIAELNDGRANHESAGQV